MESLVFLHSFVKCWSQEIPTFPHPPPTPHRKLGAGQKMGKEDTPGAHPFLPAPG